MKSRKSFCSGRVIINDIVRFWPLWGILLCGLQLLYTLPMIFYGLSYKRGNGGERAKNALLCEGAQKMYDAANPFLIAAFAILAAVLVFGYLFQKREAYMLHSLPVKRGVYFCSHILSGLAMLIVPYIVTCSMLGIICGICGANLLGVMAGVMLEMLLMIVFFYAMACLVVILCGNAAISLVVYIVANVLAVGLLALVGVTSDSVLNNTVYSMPSSEMSDGLGNLMLTATPTINFHEIMVTPKMIIDMHDSDILVERFRTSFFAAKVWEDAADMDKDQIYDLPWQQVGAMAWYLIPAVLFFLLAYYLYGKRPLERVGDVLAFPWGKPVFHVVFSLCGSYLFTEIMYLFAHDFLVKCDATYRVLFWLEMGCLLLGSVLCFFVSNMILQRTFRIWKNLSFVPLGICAVFALGLLAFFRYDCYHSNLPDGKDVRRLEMESDAEGFSSGTIFVERQEDIDEILRALQKLQDKAEDMPIKEVPRWEEEFTFHFDLENGREVELAVDCLGMGYFGKEYRKIYSVLNNPKTMIEKIFTKDYEKLQDDEYTLSLCDGDDNEFGDSDIMYAHKKELMKALQADLETGEFTFASMNPGGDLGEDRLRISLHLRGDGQKKSEKRYKPIYGDVEIALPFKFTNFWRVYGKLEEASLDMDK